MGSSHDRRRLRQVLQDWLQKEERKDGYLEARIAGLWKELMGPAVDRHTKRVRFRDGVLTVQLDSSVLREELSMGKERILQLLNARLKESPIERVILQ